MHESRLVTDLIREADRIAPEGGGTITSLTLRIGALAAVTPDAIRHGISRQAEQRWGRQPEVIVHQATSPTEPDALGVTLVSLRVED